MPRRSKGPRLWPDKARDTWTIIDGRSRYRTGCSLADIAGAKEALRVFLERQHTKVATSTPPLADVIAFYAEDHIKHVVSGKAIQYDLENLAKWWGAKQVSDVTAANCRGYTAHRNTAVSAGRELAFLRAALRYWQVHKAPTMAVPKIKLPEPAEPRQDFMTRSQAAAFLWAARRTPHICRFFILGWYTGSRRSVITSIKWTMINLDHGVLTRKARNSPRTKKRAPPIRIGRRLLSHLRRWRRMDPKATYVVEFNGKPAGRPTRAWDRAKKLAKLPSYVTPHVLRHSRATHMLRAGVPLWETAAYLGMSPAVLEKHYAHNMPDWQEAAANAR